MAQAADTLTTSGFAMPPLSTLIRDPFVRAAFQRAERDRDDSASMAVAQPRPRGSDSDRAVALVLV